MRRARESDPAGGRREPPKFDRGVKFTFLSFIVIAVMMVAMKAANPDLSMRQPVMMFAGVFVGCAFMMLIVRRMK